MLYFVYLFSSLILICNIYVESNEDLQQVTWNCASENCDSPIEEFETINNLKISDHAAKLKYNINSRGQVLGKSNDFDFWLVQIDGKQGYINKSSMRVLKPLVQDLKFSVVKNNPFVKEISDHENDISPSQPTTVFDGTTLLNKDLNESDNNNGLTSSNTVEPTPPLDQKDVTDNEGSFETQSTLADSVDPNQLGVQNGKISSDNNETSDSVTGTENNLTDSSLNILSETDRNSKSLGKDSSNMERVAAKSDSRLEEIIDNNKRNVGIGSSTPVNNYSEDEDLEEEEGGEKVPYNSTSTNDNNQWEQTNSNVPSNSTPPSGEQTPDETSKNETSNSEASNHVVLNNVMEPVKSGQSGSTHYSQQSESNQVLFSETAAESSKDTGSVTVLPEDMSTAAPPQYSEPNSLTPSQLGKVSTEQNDPLTMYKQPGPNIWNKQTDPSDNLNKNVDVSDNISNQTDPSDSSNKKVGVSDDMSNQTDPSDYLNKKVGVSDDMNNKTDSSDGLSKQIGSMKKSDKSLNSLEIKKEQTNPVESEREDLDLPKITSQPIDSGKSINEQPYTAGGPDEQPVIQDERRVSTMPSNEQPYYQYGSFYGSDPSLQKHNRQAPYFPHTDPSTHPRADATPSPVAGDKSDEESLAMSVKESSISTRSDDSSTLRPEDPTSTISGPLNTDEGTDENVDANLNRLRDVSSLVTEMTSESTNLVENEDTSIDVDETSPSGTADENLVEDRQTSDDIQFDYNKKSLVKTAEEKLETVETPVKDSSSFYSSVSSMFSSFSELFVKSQPPSDSSVLQLENTGDTDNLPSTAPPGYCFDSDTCGGLERPIGGEDQRSSPWTHSYPNFDVFKNPVPLSFNSIIYICITSVVVLLFSLGYYYIDKSQNSSTLVAKVNQLGQELFVTKKERDTLEEQLLKFKENFNMMDSSKLKQDSKLSSLQKALEESENTKCQLEEKVLILEKEMETVMDRGMEMHKLLSETISDEERSQMLLANIDELKESLSEKLNEIVVLTHQLDKKNEEIQLKQIDVRNASDRIADLERKLESCKAETEETFTKKLQQQQQKNINVQKLLEEKGVSVAKLESELAKTKAEKDLAEARATSAEAGLQSAHSVGAGEARQTWLDSTAARASLAMSNKQNEALQQNINEITASNRTLQDKISNVNEELANLNTKYENVEREKVNALTKLQVLSDYFKEKESKLQEELGVKESQWLQKESEDHTIYEQMKSLREEIASYKAQNDKLKAEILEQEASYKVQIANEEQKSYDNWVALRQAERKVKELQMESAHFRNRLTLLETANNQSASEAHNPNCLDKSNFSAPSPPFMMIPPLPSAEFFPLPPPPIHPSASRPPPLGRISSPQLSGEMLPPLPLFPFDMYPPPPSSTPPPPLPIYKPQPRDRPPPPKDSPPSNYSSESVNDKPPRRRRR